MACIVNSQGIFGTNQVPHITGVSRGGGGDVRPPPLRKKREREREREKRKKGKGEERKEREEGLYIYRLLLSKSYDAT